MQADCQEMVARRTEPNSTSPARTENPSAIQPRVSNAPTASSQKLIDSKRLAVIAKEINESIGISNSAETSVSSGGTGTDSNLNAIILVDPPLIASSDVFAHTSDDFLAVHSDYSSRRSLFWCIANLQDKSFWHWQTQVLTEISWVKNSISLCR